MPDFGLFAQAWFIAAAVAALVATASAASRVLANRRAGPSTPAGESQPTAARATAWTAFVVGVTAGFAWLKFGPRVPPAGGLDRLLVIVLPAALAVEAVGAVPRISRGFIWLLRAVVAAGIAPVVLWGSVYVSGPRREWSTGVTAGVYVGIGAAVFGVWLLTAIGNRRMTWAGAAATTVALQAAGIAMFLALYLGGGKASLPLAGALCGALAASAIYADPSARKAHGETLLSLAVVGLAGLLVVGRFFSRVGTWEAVALGAAPLLTLVGELPVLAKQRPWIATAVKLGLAAVPPAIVVYLAKRAFDQDSRLLM